jgi:hypothetical protein
MSEKLQGADQQGDISAISYTLPSPNGCYAIVPADLENLLDEESTVIERFVDFAFGTLGVQHLEVRVKS